MTWQEIYGNGRMKRPLTAIVAVVFYVVAIAATMVPTFQLLVVTTTIRIVRTTTVRSALRFM